MCDSVRVCAAMFCVHNLALACTLLHHGLLFTCSVCVAFPLLCMS